VNKSLGVIAAAAALSLAAVPAGAQQYSNSYTFLKAVKERDGNKVTELVASPGSHVLVNTEEASTGDTALHIVAQDRDLTWLSFLIGKGGKVDSRNDAGQTPLLIAANLGWVEGAELLLSQKASVNLANDRGETPLILAVQRRNLPMVRLLLSKGADPKRTDNVAGYSALDYAKRDNRSDAILKLLEQQATTPTREAAGPKL
jgi:ankyrin repeat protein